MNYMRRGQAKQNKNATKLNQFDFEPELHAI
jgi:hypothetical protein